MTMAFGVELTGTACEKHKGHVGLHVIQEAGGVPGVSTPDVKTGGMHLEETVDKACSGISAYSLPRLRKLSSNFLTQEADWIFHTYAALASRLVRESPEDAGHNLVDMEWLCHRLFDPGIGFSAHRYIIAAMTEISENIPVDQYTEEFWRLWDWAFCACEAAIFEDDNFGGISEDDDLPYHLFHELVCFWSSMSQNHSSDCRIALRFAEESFRILRLIRRLQPPMVLEPASWRDALVAFLQDSMVTASAQDRARFTEAIAPLSQALNRLGTIYTEDDFTNLQKRLQPLLQGRRDVSDRGIPDSFEKSGYIQVGRGSDRKKIACTIKDFCRKSCCHVSVLLATRTREFFAGQPVSFSFRIGNEKVVWTAEIQGKYENDTYVIKKRGILAPRRRIRNRIRNLNRASGR